MADFDLPDDTKLAGRIIENHYKVEQAKFDRGKVGALFNGKNSVPFNIAAIIAVSCALVYLLCVLRWAGTAEFTYHDGITSLSSLLTLVLGYLFGRNSKE